MSIAFSDRESTSTLEAMRAARRRTEGEVKRVTSAARVQANRRNCLKSTGPRTAEGKRRASRNALKHGLCRTLACLPSECEATFMTFVAELEAELRPATPLQRLAFNQIAGLTWRLQRLPEAQARIFEQELAKVTPQAGDERGGDGAVQLTPSDVLARRFSDDPAGNGFALMERYERGMRSQLLRLMKHYDQLQKHRATVPYDPGEPPCPDEGKRPAWTEEKARAQRAWCAEQERRFDAGEAVDPDWRRTHEVMRQQREEAARAHGADGQPTRPTAPAEPRPGAAPPSDGAERTQSKPTENPDPGQPAGKCAVGARAAVTERSQGERRAGEVIDEARDGPVESSEMAAKARRVGAGPGPSGTLTGPR